MTKLTSCVKLYSTDVKPSDAGGAPLTARLSYCQKWSHMSPVLGVVLSWALAFVAVAFIEWGEDRDA